MSVYRGKPLVNSVTGEEERLETVLPLVKKYNAAVVAISTMKPASRKTRMCGMMLPKIVERAADYGSRVKMLR